MLFIHGMLGSARYWEGVITLSMGSKRCIAIDLIGFGESPKPEDCDYSTETQVDAIIRTLDKLGVRQPVTLVGHSMGSIIALRLATLHPERVSALKLISVPVYASKQAAQHEIASAGFLPKGMMYGGFAHYLCTHMHSFQKSLLRFVGLLRKDLPRAVAEDAFKHTWYSYSRSMAEVIEKQTVLKDLSNIRIPTLLLYGAADMFVSLDRVKTTARKNTAITFQSYQGGHQLPLEHPEVVAQSILEGSYY